jgi:hypothetical protein
MKSMADSLGNHGCVVFDHNLILNVLQGLNKWYDRIRAIITHSTSFPTFHKVRDDLVLEEITLGPNMPVAPLQAFYSNNMTASPPQGHGCSRGRRHDRGDEGRGSGSSAPDQGNHPRPAQPPGPPSTTFGLEPSTCTLVRLVGRGRGGSNNTTFYSGGHLSLRKARAWSTLPSRHPWRRSRGPAVVGQPLQHDDAPDAAFTYEVDHRLRFTCHLNSWHGSPKSVLY